MKHILSILVQNRPGVLARVAGLFSRRGYNIESIAVGTTEDPDVSRMIIVVDAEERIVELIAKNVHKLIDVLKVQNLTHESYIDRELVLIKVNATPRTRSEIMQIVSIFRAHIVDVSDQSLVVEVTGDEGKIDAIVSLLRPFGIKEMVRTGRVAMARGAWSDEGQQQRPRVIA
ncbi:MAG: acetolactate synthase small subunit [Firmicutes bacterium]|nr:acetolactate synthase small subunit [Bacillota bacterium]